jgi:hypothetical protein
VPITPVERWAMARSDDSFRALAGAAGGFTSGIVTCPLDVIKTKLQAQGGFRANKSTTNAVYRGLVGTGRVIWREEGLRGLYRGLGPIILGYLPTWAVWFTVYGRSKEFISAHYRMSTRDKDRQVILANLWRRDGKCVHNSFLVIHSGWSILDNGHQPDMGDQDSFDVTSEQESNFE